MKFQLLFLFSFLPAFLTGNQETTSTIEVNCDIVEDYASLDDIMEELNGSLTFNEETNNYTYVINETEIILNMNHGYSTVNGEKEALMLETIEDSNIMTIKWATPKLIDDELYVPIQYIERIFNMTYNDSFFSMTVTQLEESAVEEDEETIASDDESDDDKNQSSTQPGSNNNQTNTNRPSGSNKPTVTPKPEEDVTPPADEEDKDEEVVPPTPPVEDDEDEDEDEEVIPPVVPPVDEEVTPPTPPAEDLIPPVEEDPTPDKELLPSEGLTE